MPYFSNASRILYSLALCALGTVIAFAQPTKPVKPAVYDPGFFQTPVLKEMFDDARFTEWVDGVEKPVETRTGTAYVLTSRTTLPGYNGHEFGRSSQTGPRHLRMGLKEPVPVGGLLVQGTGVPSLLKEGVSGGGDVTDETQWTTGIRIHEGRESRTEDGIDRQHFTLWMFPPGTRTTAFRFTHHPKATDKTFAGWIGGIYVLPERVVNLAPAAQAIATGQSQFADRLNDDSNNGLDKAWSNGNGGAGTVVSPERPEYVTLVWPKPVALRGLCTLWTGFLDADAEIYVGPPDVHPGEATRKSDWQTAVSRSGLRDGYIPHLTPNWFDFGKTAKTRAVRLRITRPLDPAGVHNHVKGRIKEGKRVWLGELMCFAPLNAATEPLALFPERAQTTVPPPIPIRFTLPEDALATLVIEKEDGTRVRNLVAETPFKKGENVVYWDGSDDLLRDPEAARHGLYNIPTRLVEPGKYVVRGLYRKPLSLRYEFSIYNEGNPPWPTADNTGGWLTNHTPPYCALWVPAEQSPTGSPLVYLGSYVSEGGHGLAWFDVQADEKRGMCAVKKDGLGWVGGFWTGAQYLARDRGGKRNPDHGAYVASVWSVAYNYSKDENKNLEVRITAMKPKGGQSSVKYTFAPLKDRPAGNWGPYLSGFAVHDGVAVLSLGLQNRLVLIGTEKGEVLETIDWEHPGGATFDANGAYYLLSDGNLYRWPKGERPRAGTKPSPLVSGLDAPKALTFDSSGNIYIAEQGDSHWVRVFSPDGRQLRTIGKKGTPQAGPYDELRMNHPSSLTIDDAGRLWVTETDFQPKRVGVWTLDGKLIRAFYGPSEYGGGGKLDPKDPTLFRYHGMEFKLDWTTGQSRLNRVYFRPGTDKLGIPDGWGSGSYPVHPIYLEEDGKTHRYLTNCFTNVPTQGTPLAMIWYDDPVTGIVRPVAAFGSVHHWSIFKRPEFRANIPGEIDLEKNRNQQQCRFVWSDADGDGQMQPEEVRYEIGCSGGIVVQGGGKDGPYFIASRVNDVKENKAGTPPTVTFLYPVKEWKGVVPVYDFGTRRELVANVQPPRSSGGDQVLYDSAENRSILTLGVDPYPRESVVGTKNGKPVWSYPNPWPGLHASHEAAVPDRPGQLIGVTRLLSDWVRVGYPQPLFAVNGNMGNAYLMTSDGIFVAELFHDSRTAPTWSMPVAQRNMDVGGLTLHDENFWPSITQTEDGRVFLVDGGRTALVRVDNLDTLREIKPFPLTVSRDDLAAAGTWLVESERLRQRSVGRPTLRVPIRRDEIIVDGTLTEWEGADWAAVDRSGVGANFNSDSKPYDITAAAAISKQRLVIAYRTNLKDLLRNSGEMPQAPFKTGGCLDLMIGANPKADPARKEPVAGDTRLLVTVIDKKPRAVLYRAVVPGTKEPVPFSSPWRTITIDRVDDVTDKIAFAEGKNGDFEIAIPTELLGLKPKSGLRINADLGVLRGNGFSTLARVYWSNKATAITSDVPSEAQLTPSLWGTWVFE